MSSRKYLKPGTNGAVFGVGGIQSEHRYSLWRRWTDDLESTNLVAFVGLNPSTADHQKNDPTVTRCINFAKHWGYDGMMMMNIFAYRATDPKDMKRAEDPVGKENDRALLAVARMVPAIVCAWGVHGSFGERGEHVKSLLQEFELAHLGTTKAGHPKHPLYLRADTRRTNWD